jgi:hypothetical protein
VIKHNRSDWIPDEFGLSPTEPEEPKVNGSGTSGC